MSRIAKTARLAALIKERNLCTKGFNRALKALVREFVTDEEIREMQADGEEEGSQPDSAEEIRADQFAEWFGTARVVPAAYRIRRDESQHDENDGVTSEGIHGVIIEVYEVENTVEISEHKLRCYSMIEDGDGPQCELHILDRYDHEIIVPSGALGMCFLLPLLSIEQKTELMKDVRARASVQHHAPVIVSQEKTQAEIANVLGDVIYGLGVGRAHRFIAQQTGLKVEVVAATARILAAQSINPRRFVGDAHARWKAAYDAVRELGIQL